MKITGILVLFIVVAIAIAGSKEVAPLLGAPKVSLGYECRRIRLVGIKLSEKIVVQNVDNERLILEVSTNGVVRSVVLAPGETATLQAPWNLDGGGIVKVTAQSRALDALFSFSPTEFK